MNVGGNKENRPKKIVDPLAFPPSTVKARTLFASEAVVLGVSWKENFFQALEIPEVVFEAKTVPVVDLRETVMDPLKSDDFA